MGNNRCRSILMTPELDNPTHSLVRRCTLTDGHSELHKGVDESLWEGDRYPSLETIAALMGEKDENVIHVCRGKTEGEINETE
jgi:hypothetical protein